MKINAEFLSKMFLIVLWRIMDKHAEKTVRLIPVRNTVNFTVTAIMLMAFSMLNPLMAQQSRSRVVEDGGTGQYTAIMESDPTLPTHTVFRPQDLSPFGEVEKLPIIAWGNGACANSPWEHVNFLSEVASHGFLVVAIGPMPAEGERTQEKSLSSQLIDAIDWAIAANEDKNSPYYGKLDTSKVSVSGMTCGG